MLANKCRVTLGLPIPFDEYVDYNDVRKDATSPQRVQFLNVNVKRQPHAVSTEPYAPFGPYFNRISEPELMRIAMLGVKTLPSASGVEKVVEEVGSRLVSRGHEVTVFTRAHLARSESLEYRGIQIRPTWSIATKHLDAVTHAVAAALSLGGRTDILHVHTTNFAPAIAISKFRGIPVVVQSHGLDWRRAKWGAGASAYLWASDATSRRWSDSVVVVSRTLEEAYKARSGRAPLYVPNGVARWSQESREVLAPLGLNGRRYVLFAARLVPEKGCHYLLEAFDRIRPADVDLVIAGEDSTTGLTRRA